MPTDLFARVISPDNLLEAWGRVRSGGEAPGLDGFTLPEFAAHLDRELQQLRRELREDRYRPWPARRVSIPKTAGGVRRIGVQAVRDRVVQRALLNLLHPRVEPLLEECSYAFRPRRSVETALAKLDEWHGRGYEWVARSDILLCFDSLSRPLLERRLAAVVAEEDVRALVGKWLTAGIVDAAGWSEPGIGVYQGDVLSPLLCNLYLDAFDEAVMGGGYPLIRYADDFVILGRSQAQVEHGLQKAGDALAGLGLEINRGKSRVGTFLQGFEYLGAALVGSLRMPLHRIERPGHPPRFVYGYDPPRPKILHPRLPFEPPLVTTQTALRDRMVGLLRQERAGRSLPPMAAALLHAWQEGGILPHPAPEPKPEGWQSVYLI